MKNQKYLLLILGILLFVSSLIFYFASNSERRTNLVSFIKGVIYKNSSVKTYDFDEKKLIIVNNSSLVEVNVDDKNKLDQILRNYNQSLSNYKDIELTIEDQEQDINFGWGTGTTFGYSLSPIPSDTLKISMFINLPIINSYQWDKSKIDSEIEFIFINSLERAVVNTDQDRATTRTDNEERIKTEDIDEKALTASQAFDNDNPKNAFLVKIL